MKSVLAASLACVMSFNLPAVAHHSHGNYVATFMDIEGVVKQVHLLNPHSWIYLEVRNASGQPRHGPSKPPTSSGSSESA